MRLWPIRPAAPGPLPAPEGLLGDRGFLWLLAGAGALRLGLMLAMWLVAWALSSNPTFEVLAYNLKAIDAFNYHRQAEQMVLYWQGLRPYYFEVLTFSAVIGALYLFLPAHPLTVVVFAVACYAGAGLLARGLAAELGRSRAWARALALLACLWPPSLAWSVVPLREGPVLLAILAVLYLAVRLCRPAGGDWGLGRGGRLAAGLGLVAAMAVLTFLRHYLWPLLCPLALLPLLALALGAGPARRRPGPGATAWALAAVLAGLALSAPLSHSGVLVFNRGLPPHPGKHGAAWELVTSAHAAMPRPPANKRYLAPKEDPAWFRLLDELSQVRRSWARAGGYTLSPEARAGEAAVSLEHRFDTWPSAVATAAALAGASLRDVLLYPFPWRPMHGGWGKVDLVMAAWAALWWLLLPGLAWGAWRALRQRPVAALALLGWCLLLTLVLGVTVLNRGTIFRLRDMVIIPLLLVWSPAPYLWAWRRLGRGQGRRPGDIMTQDATAQTRREQ